MERIMFASQVALNSVAKEISQAVEKTAQSEGVEVLLSMNNVLYASNKVDVTDEFVKNLDELIQTVAYPDPAKLGQ
jgi:Skp family chaperone for outer membrane proteins